MRWKTKSLTEWHSHFTWLPIKVKDEWVWLERILRRDRGALQVLKKNAKYNWEYVNSEFDLIKMQEKYAVEEGMATTQNLMKTQSNSNIVGVTRVYENQAMRKI